MSKCGLKSLHLVTKEHLLCSISLVIGLFNSRAYPQALKIFNTNKYNIVLALWEILTGCTQTSWEGLQNKHMCGEYKKVYFMNNHFRKMLVEDIYVMNYHWFGTSCFLVFNQFRKAIKITPGLKISSLPVAVFYIQFIFTIKSCFLYSCAVSRLIL